MPLTLRRMCDAPPVMPHVSRPTHHTTYAPLFHILHAISHNLWPTPPCPASPYPTRPCSTPHALHLHTLHPHAPHYITYAPMCHTPYPTPSCSTPSRPTPCASHPLARYTMASRMPFPTPHQACRSFCHVASRYTWPCTFGIYAYLFKLVTCLQVVLVYEAPPVSLVLLAKREGNNLRLDWRRVKEGKGG